MARSDLPDGYPYNVTLISDIYWRSPNEWPKPLIRDRHKERPAFLLEAFHKIGSRLDDDWSLADCYFEPIYPELCESDLEFNNDDVATKRKVVALIELWDPDRRFPLLWAPMGAEISDSWKRARAIGSSPSALHIISANDPSSPSPCSITRPSKNSCTWWTLA